MPLKTERWSFRQEAGANETMRSVDIHFLIHRLFETSSLFQALYSILNKLYGQKTVVLTDTRRSSDTTVEEIMVVGVTEARSKGDRLQTIQPAYVIQRVTGYGSFKDLRYIIVEERFDK